MAFKILFSNLGYARGIGGAFDQHIRHIHQHFYTSQEQQRQVLSQFKGIINVENPDLCCLVEIDSGSWNTGYFNQIDHLIDQSYPIYNMAGKYGEDSLLSQMPFFKGKCSAFLSKTGLPFRKLYFKHGSKRLLYNISLPGDVQLFFGHFSLQSKVRAKQLAEVRKLVEECPERVIILADFNILHGFKELQPLLENGDLCVLNREEDHTFMFGNTRWTLDLCICSKSLAPDLHLKVIPQPFSDHAALLVESASLHAF